MSVQRSIISKVWRSSSFLCSVQHSNIVFCSPLVKGDTSLFHLKSHSTTSNAWSHHLSGHRYFSTDIEYRAHSLDDIEVNNVVKEPVMEPLLIFKELLVHPGSLIKVSLPTLPADITVNIGKIDRIGVQVSSTQQGGDLRDHVQVVASPSQQGTLEVLPVVQHNSADPATAHLHQPPTMAVTAWIPERFASVDVSTGGGSVHVSAVTEGALRVASHGGDITLGKIRSAEATVDSSGGQVSGEVLAAMLKLNTQGGDCNIKRVVGGELELNTGAGDVAFNVLYGDHVNITCGSAKIEQMRIGVAGKVSASVGGVEVRGLDGPASIETCGGRVDLQLQENAKAVQVVSQGGEVALQVPALVQGGVAFKAAPHGDLTLSPDLCLDESGLLKAVDVNAKDQQFSSHRMSLEGIVDQKDVDCVLDVNSGGGKIDVKLRSWFQARFG